MVGKKGKSEEERRTGREEMAEKENRGSKGQEEMCPKTTYK